MLRGEIITVGSELLLGQITNTNSKYISMEMAGKGIPVFFHVSVGDNCNRLKQAIEIAKKRSNLIVITGGLGPTKDDITKEVVSEVINKKLILHKPTYEKINNFFISRGLIMTENNIKQAEVFEDSTVFSNNSGLAAGIGIKIDEIYYILLPGPPSEMNPMFKNSSLPWIEQFQTKKVFFSKVLRFAGIGESLVDEKINDLLENQSNPTIAPLVDNGEVTLRLTAKATDKEEALSIIKPVSDVIISRLNDYYFGSGDANLENVVVNMLKNLSLSISTAESCTGGLVGTKLTKLSGSSSFYRGGIICYTNEIKNKILDIPMSILETEGAVSHETAKILAENVRNIFNSDIGLSVTGVAGPDLSENKPVGLVYLGISEKNIETSVYKINLVGDRNIIQNRATNHLFYLLYQKLKAKLN